MAALSAGVARGQGGEVLRGTGEGGGSHGLRDGGVGRLGQVEKLLIAPTRDSGAVGDLIGGLTGRPGVDRPDMYLHLLTHSSGGNIVIAMPSRSS